MLILYLLPVCPPSFVISLLLLIWCNVMKWLEATPWWGGGALLGWRSRGGRHFQALAQAHPIVQARAEERRTGERRREDGGRGDSRQQPRTERLGDRCRRCREGPPSEMAASSQPHYAPPEDSPSNACVITPQPALPPPRTKAPATPDTCR